MKDPQFYASRLMEVQNELAAANHDGETDLELGLVMHLQKQFHIAGVLAKSAHLSSWQVLKLAATHSPAAQKLYDDMARSDVT